MAHYEHMSLTAVEKQHRADNCAITLNIDHISGRKRKSHFINNVNGDDNYTVIEQQNSPDVDHVRE